MTTLTEGDLRLALPVHVKAREFDDGQHGLSHCMKAVDWILEFPERICFVEVKDPDVRQARNHGNRIGFLQKFQSGELDGDLVAKFRDSFLYEWACKRVDKPIDYYVIVASANLDDALLMNRVDDLGRKLPVGKPAPASWAREMVEKCIVFNIAKWNDVFPDCPLQRV